MIAGDEAIEGLGFLAVALGHAVVFRDGLSGNLAGERPDGAGETFDGLRTGDGGGIGPGFFAGGRREEGAAVIALGGLDALTGGSEEKADFGADEEIVGA